jgi:hypothetical protein
LMEGAIIAALVRGDPGMAAAAKAAARILLTSAGVHDPDGETRARPKRVRRNARTRG